jgi:hypothetical protein
VAAAAAAGNAVRDAVVEAAPIARCAVAAFAATARQAAASSLVCATAAVSPVGIANLPSPVREARAWSNARLPEMVARG